MEQVVTLETPLSLSSIQSSLTSRHRLFCYQSALKSLTGVIDKHVLKFELNTEAKSILEIFCK